MASTSALIGYSGFVGGNLLRQHAFAARYNTSNIHTLSEQEFGTLVCAAAPGSMFEANRDPERDLAKIAALIDHLDRAKASRVVLISSIAVLDDFAAGYDELTQSFQQQLAYGRNRRQLEAFCEMRFRQCLIIRLPALFGPGLRKNFLFDLMNPAPSMLTAARFETLLEWLPPLLRSEVAQLYRQEATGILRLDRPAFNANLRRREMESAMSAGGWSATAFHNPSTTYQFYDMARLWSDIEIALRAGVPCIHLATEPVSVHAIHYRLLNQNMASNAANPHHEDMRTRYGALWNQEGPYLENGTQVLNKLEGFFRAEAAAGSTA